MKLLHYSFFVSQLLTSTIKVSALVIEH